MSYVAGWYQHSLDQLSGIDIACVFLDVDLEESITVCWEKLWKSVGPGCKVFVEHADRPPVVRLFQNRDLIASEGIGDDNSSADGSRKLAQSRKRSRGGSTDSRLRGRAAQSRLAAPGALSSWAIRTIATMSATYALFGHGVCLVVVAMPPGRHRYRNPRDADRGGLPTARDGPSHGRDDVPFPTRHGMEPTALPTLRSYRPSWAGV